MERTVVAGKPLIKISGEWRPQGKGPHDDVEVRVAYGMFHIPTLLQFIDGVSLTEIRLQPITGGWRGMIKGTRGKEKLVAWFYGASLHEVLVLLVTSADTGYVDWGPDRPWKPKK